ncbi:MAG TPA: class II aldolase/adducin family protein [Anaerolineales bacterium]|jgi:rhamnulose-1-phosphate aldolase|nr:class II aldolase/adducin family protein [Anaerolineales bacterium]
MTSTSLDLRQLLNQLGQVGKRLSDIGAAEAAAGNLSICFRQSLDLLLHFPEVQEIHLPVPAPDLSGATLIVSGSGRRLRDILEAPTANLACIVVEPGGQKGRMFTSPDCQFQRVTSEFNSHLAVHHDQIRRKDSKLHTVLHAQPVYLTYLSHITAYQEERYLNRHLTRWQPEMLLNFPEGIGTLPFLPPASTQLTIESVLALREHRMVIWSQHGVMARADESLFHALDLIEYAETAAHYEYLNLCAGERSEGLSPGHMQEISKTWKIQQNIF